MTAAKIQNWAWGLFFIYYFASKYFVGGFTGFSINYLISVIILVALTAVIPFYAAKWTVGKTSGALQFVAAILMPSILTAAGLSVYFFLFIQPNYETIKLPAIIHRAFTPGIAISILLLIPLVAAMRKPSDVSDAS